MELPDRPWVDRLVRGRAWIFVVGAGLLGVVAVQVTLLKVNASIGRTTERIEHLAQSDAVLRQQVSALSSDGRVRAAAARAGLVMPAPGSVRYLTVHPRRDVPRAARAATGGD
jgi:cell division protein FtsB